MGNARCIGVRLADVLVACGGRPPDRGGPADQLVSRSVDGMPFGMPVDDVMDGRDALLPVGMNGRPLPFGHGFPLRMIVPALYGYVCACKWIEDIELTTFDAHDPYWVKRGWARRAPIKTQSRIDTPKPFARLRAGQVCQRLSSQPIRGRSRTRSHWCSGAEEECGLVLSPAGPRRPGESPIRLPMRAAPAPS